MKCGKWQRLTIAAFAATIGACCAESQIGDPGPRTFLPAYLHPGEHGQELTLFPLDGPQVPSRYPPDCPDIFA